MFKRSSKAFAHRGGLGRIFRTVFNSLAGFGGGVTKRHQRFYNFAITSGTDCFAACSCLVCKFVAQLHYDALRRSFCRCRTLS